MYTCATIYWENLQKVRFLIFRFDVICQRANGVVELTVVQQVQLRRQVVSVFPVADVVHLPLVRVGLQHLANVECGMELLRIGFDVIHRDLASWSVDAERHD